MNVRSVFFFFFKSVSVSPLCRGKRAPWEAYPAADWCRGLSRKCSWDPYLCKGRGRAGQRGKLSCDEVSVILRMVPQVALKLGSPLRVVPRSDEKVQKDRPVESAALESVHDRGRGSRRRALIAERGLPGALLHEVGGMHTLVLWGDSVSQRKPSEINWSAGIARPTGDFFCKRISPAFVNVFPSIGTCRHRHLRFRKSASCLAFWFYN